MKGEKRRGDRGGEKKERRIYVQQNLSSTLAASSHSASIPPAENDAEGDSGDSPKLPSLFVSRLTGLPAMFASPATPSIRRSLMLRRLDSVDVGVEADCASISATLPLSLTAPPRKTDRRPRGRDGESVSGFSSTKPCGAAAVASAAATIATTEDCRLDQFEDGDADADAAVLPSEYGRSGERPTEDDGEIDNKGEVTLTPFLLGREMAPVGFDGGVRGWRWSRSRSLSRPSGDDGSSLYPGAVTK